ncbi:MAG: hypothetical protein KDK91_09300, partial [Gammaproteobacteria bacterium]|nr:hypothetical protein [Gammaproteobacteria bacterium]
DRKHAQTVQLIEAYVTLDSRGLRASRSRRVSAPPVGLTTNIQIAIAWALAHQREPATIPDLSLRLGQIRAIP